MMARRWGIAGLILLAVCLWLMVPTPAVAQTYQTFRIARPVAVGTAPTGLDSTNRIYRAYTGIPYNIHADAVGGRWPYHYTLTNAPAGMTIEAGPCTVIGPTCTAGTINWPSPTGTASNIVVHIFDADNQEVTGTWTITSSTTIGANGFCFVDANNSAGGRDGSRENPYNSLLEVYNSCGADSIVYFRAGTYPTSVLSSVQTSPSDYLSSGYQVFWNKTSRSIIWIGYPGETALIDFGATGSNIAQVMEWTGNHLWLDNLSATNIMNIGWRFTLRQQNYGAVVRRMTFTNLMDAEDTFNSSFVMWGSHAVPDETYFDTYQNSTADVIQGDGAGVDSGDALKTYGTKYLLVENNWFANNVTSEAVIALKSSSPGATVRGNICESTVKACIGGNMAKDTGGNNPTGGEVYHNLCLGSGTANTEGCIVFVRALVHPTDPFAVYRNTFIGQVNFMHFVGSDTSGPFTFGTNVILNSGGTGGSCPLRGSCNLISGAPFDYTRYVDSGNNVLGANDGTIANATTGVLVGASRTTYLGVAGFELGLGSEASRLSPWMFRR